MLTFVVITIFEQTMKPFLTILFLSITLLVAGQTSPINYMFRVFLTDKGAADYSISRPEEFLTKEAIERKLIQNVPIDSSDFPINKDYFVMVQNAGAEVVSFSKWFDLLVVKVEDSTRIESIAKLPFVERVEYVWRGEAHSNKKDIRPRLQKVECKEELDSTSYFGATKKQYELHNAENLVQSGFRGKGMNIAIIDAGFTNADVIPSFDNIRIMGIADIVPNGTIFNSSDHGTKVLSTMVVDLPNQMIGSASQADYLLLRSEDTRSEFPVEEDYWIRAVEFADSMGVDLINTSLGYNQFDDPQLSYNYSNLDGKTSLMTKAADKAFDKGMILVISMGNEGNKPWKYMTPPADARNVLSIGAIGVDSTIASFSSLGPTYDLRIKPDLLSVGKNTVTIGQEGLIGSTNGTSLSSPFMAGLITSLWSIHPELNRRELIKIVKQSTDRYSNPDKETGYGYGIPDFGKSMKAVLQTLESNKKTFSDNNISIYPDKDQYVIKLIDPPFFIKGYSVNLLDQNGELIDKLKFNDQKLAHFPKSKLKGIKEVFFVVDSPRSQQTIRIKL
jgi:subtilisin family serine protease